MTTAAPTQRNLPLEVSARCTLVTLEFVRNLRGCDAESVLDCVGDGTHPRHLRFVFDMGLDTPRKRRRELRFWRDEAVVSINLPGHYRELPPVKVIDRILGARQEWPRGEIEVAWTINATTISRLIRAGELTEVNRKITRASLAAFLQRRLQ